MYKRTGSGEHVPDPVFSLELSVEYVFVQSVKGFLNTAQRQSQVQTDVGLAVEIPAVLPDHTDIPAGLQKFVHGLAGLFQPAGTVDEEHVCLCYAT